MTQMMLFDAPASTPSFAVTTVETDRVVSTPAEVPAQREGGLHHMGDLARLVLLRYELVAKRRARRERAASERIGARR